MALKPQNSRTPPWSNAAVPQRCKSPRTKGKGLWRAPVSKSKSRRQNGRIQETPFLKETDMQIFRFNEPTRMDTVIHLCLGLAAVVAVVCSVEVAIDFCGRLDQLAESFQTPSAVGAVTDEREMSTFTNAASVEAPVLDAGQVQQTNLPGLAPAAADRGLGSPASG